MYSDSYPTTLCSLSPDGNIVVPPNGHSCLAETINYKQTICTDSELQTCSPCSEQVVVRAPPRLIHNGWPPRHYSRQHISNCQVLLHGGGKPRNVALLYCNPRQSPCEWEERLREFIHRHVWTPEYPPSCTWEIYLVCETSSDSMRAEAITARWCSLLCVVSVLFLGTEGFHAGNSGDMWMDHPSIASIACSVPEERLYVIGWPIGHAGQYIRERIMGKQCVPEQCGKGRRWYSQTTPNHRSGRR